MCATFTKTSGIGHLVRYRARVMFGPTAPPLPTHDPKEISACMFRSAHRAMTQRRQGHHRHAGTDELTSCKGPSPWEARMLPPPLLTRLPLFRLLRPMALSRMFCVRRLSVVTRGRGPSGEAFVNTKNGRCYGSIARDFGECGFRDSQHSA